MANRNFVVSMTFMVIVFCNMATAEENYWEKIKGHLGAKTREEAQEGKRYLSSLKAEELYWAAIQCSKEMQVRVKPDDWDVALLNLGFFYESYPLSTNGLKNINAMLADMKDKSQLLFWRCAVIYLLQTDAWQSELNAKQTLNVARTMREVFTDSSEPMILRTKIIRRSATFLTQAYYMILHQDPLVKQIMRKRKMQRGDLIAGVRSGKIKTSPRTIALIGKLQLEIGKSITEQLSLFADPHVPTELRESILAAWERYDNHKLDLPDVEQVVAHALERHKAYDEQLWLPLALINIDFGNIHVKKHLDAMISQIGDKKRKTQLAELRQRIEKGKN